MSSRMTFAHVMLDLLAIHHQLYSADATGFTSHQPVVITVKFGFREWHAQIPRPSLTSFAPSRVMRNYTNVTTNAHHSSMLHRRCSRCLLHSTHYLHRLLPSQPPHHRRPHCSPHSLRLPSYLPHLCQQAHRPSAYTSVSFPVQQSPPTYP